jgi:hypothetical protein
MDATIHAVICDKDILEKLSNHSIQNYQRTILLTLGEYYYQSDSDSKI